MQPACFALQVPYDELGSSGSGGKQHSFLARASTSYYAVLEDTSDDCSVSSVNFYVTEILNASALPRKPSVCLHGA